MGFQILNTNKEALSINQLDVEAANFWNKPVHPKQYANPFIPTEGMSEMDRIKGEMVSNWFDIIGYYIHHPFVEYSSGWANVKCSLYALHLCNMWSGIKPDRDRPIEHQKAYLEYVATEHLKPYFDLINHWEDKGYIPIKVND